MTLPVRLLTADLLDVGLGEAVPGGGVAESAGQVLCVGRAADLRARFPDAAEQRAGRVIAPLPVNTHTHLDLSLLPFRALPYDRWVLEHVAANLHLSGREGAKQGLRALRGSSVSAFGDITELSEVMTFLLGESDVPGVVYWQVFDPNPATADETFRRTVEQVRAFRCLERPGGVRVGLSPHATYTVSYRLHRLLADFARQEGLPMQIHAAEHGGEFEMFRSGTGPLAEAFLRVYAHLTLEDVFGRSPDPALTPVGHLADLGVLEARPTLIHMVHVTQDDVRTVSEAKCAVVTCPRSNAALECGTFDWPLFAQHGVEVALGTDSVASGETLDIHDEIAAARLMHPGLDDHILVRAALHGGTHILGQEVPRLREGSAWSERFIWPDRNGRPGDAG